MSAATAPSVESIDDDFDPFATGAIERVIATTEPQREIWLGADLSEEASLAYNLSLVLRIQGELDSRALVSALDHLVARHESLRATISSDGSQMLIAESAPLALAEHDLRDLDASAQATRLAQASLDAVQERFVLDQGPLFRAALFRISAVENVLMLSAHHAVCDGWSWGVIRHDLEQLYVEQIGKGPAPKPASQYSEYAAWEAAQADSAEMQEHIDYWLSCFRGSLPVLDLPLDRPRPAVRTFNSFRVDHFVAQETVDALRKTGASLGASLFSTMFSAFAVLLHRLSAQDDLVIGIPAAGQVNANMPSLVGHCVNFLPIRVAIDTHGEFNAFVRKAGSVLLDAFEHQALTYGTLLRNLPVARDPSRLPLVSVLFNVHAEHGKRPAAHELQIEQSTIGRRFENFELFLNIAPVAGGVQLELQYNADLFDESTARRWLEMYDCVLRAAALDPSRKVGQLDIIPASQIAAVASLQPAPVPPTGRPLVHAAFVDGAGANAERTALSLGEARMSYRELDEASNQLAHALRARGVGRGQLVGLCLDRDMDMVVALLAVLKSGAGYVPLDPAFPQARLDYYAQDAKLALLLTATNIASAPTHWREDAADRVFCIDDRALWSAQPTTALAPDLLDAQPADVAYVIYTSGSTGKPKGVCVPHRAVANFLQSMAKAPGLLADDRLAAVTTLSFDIAVLELLLPLSVGAQIVLVPRDTSMDGHALRALVEGSGATVMQATPSTWRLLLDAQWRGNARFKALIGGESLPADMARALGERCGELWNMYGPTETTVWSTIWRVDPEMTARKGVSIGVPIDNTTVWILDEHGQRCPIGVPGEICIGGLGVTLGYLDRPELTAERFVPDRYGAKGAMMYRTGDLGRWRNDGLLEHRGRLDFQVKVRGYRIELGEIENCCNQLASVGSSVVITREDQPGDVRLAAYVTPAPGAVIDIAALESALRERLPQYMVPQHLVVLDTLPLLPNGKIDRKALPQPVAVAPRDAQEHVAPRNDHESTVAAHMERVLGHPGVGIREDFFALGGHSLLAARLTTLLSQEFGIRIPLRTLFEHPTVERLAAAITDMQTANVPSADTIAHDPARRSAPLTPMQERIRFVEELHPGRAVYNVPSGHRLTGPLDKPALEASLREIIRRQSALRSFVAVDAARNQPRQWVNDTVPFELAFEDLRAIAPHEREAALLQRMQAVADTPIDMGRDPLFRAALFQVADEEHALAFVPHHLIWDGWSTELLQEELAALYGAFSKGQPSPLPDLAVNYGDYAAWYEDWLAGADARAQLDYWKQRFARARASVSPCTDFPRRAGMSGEGRSHFLRIDDATTQGLRDIAREHNVTLNMLTLALLSLMTSRAIGSPAVVIATPVRGRELPEIEGVMGFFNNLLLVPFEPLGSLSLGQYLQAVKRELVASMDKQRVPFERIAAEPEFSQRAQQGALYQALFSFQDARERKQTMGALRHQPIRLMQRGATDDFGVWMTDTPDGLEAAMTYNADIYSDETGKAFRDRYLELLQKAARMPGATLDDIAAPGDSAAAAHLRRLDPSAGPHTPVTDHAPIEHSATQQLLMPEQARLAQVWASVLGIDVNDIRATDSFFDLGGDSLLAMRAVQQGEQAMGFRIEARRYVFESLAQLSSSSGALTAAAPVAQQVEAAPRGLFGRVMSVLGRR